MSKFFSGSSSVASPRFGTAQSTGTTVLSVSELTSQIKDELQSAFSSIHVVGEISNLARPRSGHVYLTLKDEGAQLKAVAWRSMAARIRFPLEDGLEVICRGDIDVYPPHGTYQLIIRRIEPLGVGALQAALRKLRDRLAAEGLFGSEHKKPLPVFPRRLAILTSPTGAAIHDFLKVAARRWNRTPIMVIPARVQGDEAANEIVSGIATANRLTPTPDVLVVGRGGGSLEDLWCFNDERVVRAIFASSIPVVSAVGHEIDVTLSDLVSDVRALTPTEAAELILPSADELRDRMVRLRRQMTVTMRTRITEARSRVESLQQRRALKYPHERLRDLARRIDELEQRSARAVESHLSRTKDRITSLAGKLEALSPLATLARGYSVTSRVEDDSVIHDASSLEPGELIRTQFHRGSVISQVRR